MAEVVGQQAAFGSRADGHRGQGPSLVSCLGTLRVSPILPWLRRLHFLPWALQPQPNKAAWMVTGNIRRQDGVLVGLSSWVLFKVVRRNRSFLEHSCFFLPTAVSLLNSETQMTGSRACSHSILFFSLPLLPFFPSAKCLLE